MESSQRKPEKPKLNSSTASLDAIEIEDESSTSVRKGSYAQPKGVDKKVAAPAEQEDEVQNQKSSTKDQQGQSSAQHGAGGSKPSPLVIDDSVSDPHETDRRVSEAGTVVIHGNAEDSPLEVSEGMQKLLVNTPAKSKGSAFSKGDGAGRAEPTESSDVPSEDFEELDIAPDAAAVSNGHAESAAPPIDRVGVTVAPPPSPKAASSSKQPEQATAENSNEGKIPKKGGSTVAEELAEAEAKANKEALASQRANSLQKVPSREAQEANNIGEAEPFTEEALNSTEDGTVSHPQASSEPKAFATPAAAARPPLEVSADDIQSYEPPEYKGLVYHDGVDSMGRPVIVVNADALAPRTSRKDAISYMQQRLEPIVVQGPYVLIFLNSGSSMRSTLSPGWLASCYRQMSYPFRKNVKYVILVRPSAALRFMLAIMKPLVKPKSFHKVKKVPNLSAMAAATNSEVTIQHLGTRFATAAGQGIVDAEIVAGGANSAFQMPSLGNVEMSQRR